MEYLLGDITAALHASHPRQSSRKLSIRSDDGVYPILKFWPDGLQVIETDAPRLRGYVDIMDEDDRLFRCLIVHAKTEHGVVTYDFKRKTADTGTAPLSHVLDDDAPVALIT